MQCCITNISCCMYFQHRLKNIVKISNRKKNPIAKKKYIQQLALQINWAYVLHSILTVYGIHISNFILIPIFYRYLAVSLLSKCLSHQICPFGVKTFGSWHLWDVLMSLKEDLKLFFCDFFCYKLGLLGVLKLAILTLMLQFLLKLLLKLLLL